jgi:ketosteroid isomerase-like protein
MHSDSPLLVWRRYNDAENRRDGPATQQLISESLTVTTNGRPAVTDSEHDARIQQALYSRFPDFRRDFIGGIESGDTAVVRWVMRGTPVSPGPSLEVYGCSIVTVNEGRIVAAELYYCDSVLDGLVAETSAWTQGSEGNK